MHLLCEAGVTHTCHPSILHLIQSKQHMKDCSFITLTQSYQKFLFCIWNYENSWNRSHNKLQTIAAFDILLRHVRSILNPPKSTIIKKKQWHILHTLTSQGLRAPCKVLVAWALISWILQNPSKPPDRYWRNEEGKG